jgi:hypothetical protein
MSEKIGLLANLILLASACLAYFGVNSWRSQISCKAKHDAALEILKSFHIFIYTIKFLRPNFITYDEMNEVHEYFNKSHETKIERDPCGIINDDDIEIKVFYFRLQNKFESINNFIIQKYTCKAIFGENESAFIEKTTEIFFDLQVTVSQLARLKKRIQRTPPNMRSKYLENKESLLEKLRGGENDEIENKIKELELEADRLFRPHLLTPILPPHRAVLNWLKTLPSPYSKYRQ